MVYPWEKQEYKNSEEWTEKSRHGELEVIPCISGWMDVCGFGSALKTNSWDLVDLQKNGLLELLSLVYQRAGHPFLIGVEPMPYESVLILNDGVSRTVDLNRPECAHAHQFIFYLRDLFFLHRSLLQLTKSFGYGIRTVFAGGERVQYSPTLFTGNSVLQHDENNISDFGKKLLDKNFLHNPAEFQMNTAFAKSYSIESLGSKHGFEINGCYVETSFWDLIANIPNLDIEEKDSSKLIYFNGNPALQVYFLRDIKTSFKGLDMNIQQVESIRIDEKFEGEETFCDINKV